MGKRRPLISIIMPCYNAGQYLEESITSVLRSTIASDIELIIINDGSTDCSEMIIDKYSNQDTILTIKHKTIENSGVSIARNIGIDCAVGDYLVFLDADDKQSPMMLEALAKGVLETHSDICFCEWTDKVTKVETTIGKATPLDVIDFMRILLYRLRPVGMWSVLFCRELISNNSIRFSSSTKYGEDLEFLWHAVLCAKSAAGIDARYYYYRPSLSSAMRSTTWRKTEVMGVMEKISNSIQQSAPDFYDEFKSYMIPRTLLSLLKDYAQSHSKENYNRLEQEYRCRKELRKIRKGGIKVWISSRLYCFSPKLFYSLFKILA